VVPVMSKKFAHFDPVHFSWLSAASSASSSVHLLGSVLTASAVFRDQEIDIHQQLELARHFGPLHKHATTPIPREPGLEEVHGQSPSNLHRAVHADPHMQSCTTMPPGSRTPPPSPSSSSGTPTYPTRSSLRRPPR
jgi:alpha-ketoglutarate-dependent taurine dioxygenase